MIHVDTIDDNGLDCVVDNLKYENSNDVTCNINENNNGIELHTHVFLLINETIWKSDI